MDHQEQQTGNEDAVNQDPVQDEHAWLEDVEGEAQLDWVRERNAGEAARIAGTPQFEATSDRILSILDSDAKIPDVAKIGEHYYNFWKDAEHERGLWRRTSLESYRTEAPDWEIVLDLDALNEAEGENWVWHGATVLRRSASSETDDHRLAMVDLSRGGADADVSREFDLHAKTFVEDGFHRPEAKGNLSWIDQDTLFLMTDLGPGSLTDSGYPRTARRWHRGTPIEEAEVVFEGDATDIAVAAWHDQTPGHERDLIHRAPTFFTSELHLLDPDGSLIRIEVPDSAQASVTREWLTIELRDDWTPEEVTYAAGSLLGIRLADFLAGSRDVQVLFAPTPARSLAGHTWTRHHLVLNILEHVTNRLEVLTPEADGIFASTPLPGVPDVGTTMVGPVDGVGSDAVWVYTTDFLTPTTLAIADLADLEQSGAATDFVVEPLKAMPAFFDADGLIAQQRFVTSDDGTRVPYFLVHREGLPADGTTPTLLYGYGGFEISLTPTYSGVLGSSWLERGGAYALANIRGGGEYGPTWHQAALKENRHRAYEDMAAVARDLVDTGVTVPEKLGVQGGSNGGLLAGNMLTQYPDLFGAVVIQVPLLDMQRYSHLLAGASWMAEYGDPDVPEEWAFLQTFSPYHLFEAGRDYPPVLLTTSTRDDRVHPAHARKMAARMLAAGKDVTYYENIEGGHGGAATNGQLAHMQALAYRFLAERLGLG
ncbi:prolyl oligopeptidase family serine peptidase [Ornithinimicrobium faecis]|uniref:prolyl oligopeptidase family serine peptidase n=1 Tax=Ornithinimicrobium faecis TaxID=2934158 RepID=UPI0021190F5B|nr:prolyl oligopeptidase family serine peptidase [Ornithinimicrobium sp. HY1745]